jgi:uncharacterized membrane protein
MSQRDHKECAEDIEGRDSFISALTGRRAVMECWWHMSIGNYAPDLKSRKESVTSFFNAKNPKEALRVLKDYSVDYVWASADRAINFDPKGLLEEVYSNRSVKIYRVLQ